MCCSIATLALNRPGMRKASQNQGLSGKTTSFDIAQLAGVSQPTVSRALRGSSTVSEQTRKRIEAIARQLNYKVDKNASSLRTQETNTLALLDRKSTRLNSSHLKLSRMPSSA